MPAAAPVDLTGAAEKPAVVAAAGGAVPAPLPKGASSTHAGPPSGLRPTRPAPSALLVPPREPPRPPVRIEPRAAPTRFANPLVRHLPWVVTGVVTLLLVLMALAGAR
jgi:hypothetical protein